MENGCWPLAPFRREKGYITDPHGHRESVYLTERGLQLAKRLADEMFGLPGAPGAKPGRWKCGLGGWPL
ncbi:hypothetical protein SAMN05446927_1027 [Caballeronia arationis]|uniref:DUF6429 domain-containing protein n=1 Tax=Caballeronia arationis TaxID=1777142 RepID=A0A7Z7I2F3_9BURK|nr:hypothetical protein SAMN05446927_1027 [Caballeronia arationis]